MIIAYEFPLRGGCIPQNHGYQLFSALSRVHPWLHARGKLQIAPINGRRLDNDPSMIQITPRSVLQIRGISPEEAVALSESGIFLGGSILRLGDPKIRKIQVGPRLASRLVILGTPDDFAGNLVAEIQHFTGETPTIKIGRLRALPIKDIHLKGYSVEIRGLSEAGSQTLLRNGLGKCRTMGCGVFRAYDDRYEVSARG